MLLTIIISIVTGFISGLLANYAYDKIKKQKKTVLKGWGFKPLS